MKYEKINQYVCQNIAYYVKKFANGKDETLAVKALAEATEIPEERLTNIINGKAKVNIVEVYRITTVLGVDVNNIITTKVNHD